MKYGRWVLRLFISWLALVLLVPIAAYFSGSDRAVLWLGIVFFLAYWSLVFIRQARGVRLTELIIIGAVLGILAALALHIVSIWSVVSNR